MGVILGKTDAGATLDVDLDKESAQVRERLRVIMQTDGINPHPVAAHPRVPERFRLALRDAILRQAAGDKGRERLAAARLSEPVVADYQADYQFIEEIVDRKAAGEE